MRVVVVLAMFCSDGCLGGFMRVVVVVIIVVMVFGWVYEGGGGVGDVL